MTRQRRKSEMPTDEEVMDTKIWTLAHHLDTQEVIDHVTFVAGSQVFKPQEVVIDMGTSPYHVTVRGELIQLDSPDNIAEFIRRVKAGELDGENTAVETKPVEGTPRDD